MPAKSKAQQKAAGAALSAKRGDTEKSDLKGASRGMYESMSEKELEDLRAEYAHVPVDKFLAAREHILRKLLGRPRLFVSPLSERWEEPARQNLTAELARVEKELAKLAAGSAEVGTSGATAAGDAAGSSTPRSQAPSTTSTPA